MICDYEGSDYKTRFWQNANRAYEDAVERVAIERLLPPKGTATGQRIIEFGAGFGRLADLYTGYDEIVLLDYSRSLLEQAQERWGNDPRFKFVAADLYHLPFASGVLNAATMIRVIHHIGDVPAALKQIRAAMAPGGTFVLEFANKRNLKSMARHALGKQSWSPYAPEPVEFVKLNYDFHPRWMFEQLKLAGFETQQKLSVSYLRAGFFKRVLPLKAMVRLDAALQKTSGAGLLSPSVFTQNKARDESHQNGRRVASDEFVARHSSLDIFRSPKSGAPLHREGDLLVCDVDGTRWQARGNFYDFKEPVG
ncbi:MAG: class I SAM-dependent methyltransferase [Anaerolineae bacterium]|nr:class I SAM-dependent methyltransferase [Anaerolineae bacterium]